MRVGQTFLHDFCAILYRHAFPSVITCSARGSAGLPSRSFRVLFPICARNCPGASMRVNTVSPGAAPGKRYSYLVKSACVSTGVASRKKDGGRSYSTVALRGARAGGGGGGDVAEGPSLLCSPIHPPVNAQLGPRNCAHGLDAEVCAQPLLHMRRNAKIASGEAPHQLFVATAATNGRGKRAPRVNDHSGHDAPLAWSTSLISASATDNLARRTTGWLSPRYGKRMARILKPRLCQSTMKEAPRSRHTSHATNMVGIEGGF